VPVFHIEFSRGVRIRRRALFEGERFEILISTLPGEHVRDGHCDRVPCAGELRADRFEYV
jgi:hypothetical protein